MNRILNSQKLELINSKKPQIKSIIN